MKRRFGSAGIINVIITNLILQSLISIDFFSVYISTLIAQLFNGFFGYLIYGKIVFKVKVIRKINTSLKYSFLMILLWLFNGFCIEFASNISISKNLAAAMMIPILASISYFTQKNFIFNVSS